MVDFRDVVRRHYQGVIFLECHAGLQYSETKVWPISCHEGTEMGEG
jgi:hypothetical protein